MLRTQTSEKLGFVDFRITVLSIDQYYEQGSQDDIIILNEYDQLIDQNLYSTLNGSLVGLWSLKHKKVYAFTATSSKAYERFTINCIGDCATLQFKSEYEMIHGVAPV